jgi:peptidyl-prolyl cis-trans isomerase A (cyclophilin A)
MKVLAILLLAGSAVLAQTPAPAKATPKSAAKTGAAKTGAAKTVTAAPAASRAALLNPAGLRAKAPELFKVKLTTTKGDIDIEVHRAWAPLGTDRFYNLVRNRYFTGAAFFRVVPNFIVQFGMSPDPAVGKVWQNANIKDDPRTQTNKRSYVVFATAGPNTRTTQLFINLKDNAFLDAQGFAPFGVVTEGMAVVEQLYSGYGETPDQGLILTQGKAYLDKNFPKLDTIKSAAVILPEGAAPAPAAAPAAAPAPAKKTAPAAGAASPAPKKTVAPVKK